DFHVTGVQTCALPIFGSGVGDVQVGHDLPGVALQRRVQERAVLVPVGGALAAVVRALRVVRLRHLVVGVLAGEVVTVEVCGPGVRGVLGEGARDGGGDAAA